MVNRCDLILNVTYTIEIWSILIYGCFVTNSIVFTSQCSGLNSRAFNPFWQATNTSSQVNYNDHANGLSRFFPLFVYKMNYHTKINDYYRFFLSLLFWNESHENLLLLERRKKLIAHNSTVGIFLYNFAHFNTINGETVASKSTFFCKIWWWLKSWEFCMNESANNREGKKNSAKIRFLLKFQEFTLFEKWTWLNLESESRVVTNH